LPIEIYSLEKQVIHSPARHDLSIVYFQEKFLVDEYWQCEGKKHVIFTVRNYPMYDEGRLIGATQNSRNWKLRDASCRVRSSINGSKGGRYKEELGEDFLTYQKNHQEDYEFFTTKTMRSYGGRHLRAFYSFATWMTGPNFDFDEYIDELSSSFTLMSDTTIVRGALTNSKTPWLR
jgi:hypothetical protein